jgi:hypothetical protein
MNDSGYAKSSGRKLISAAGDNNFNKSSVNTSVIITTEVFSRPVCPHWLFLLYDRKFPRLYSVKLLFPFWENFETLTLFPKVFPSQSFTFGFQQNAHGRFIENFACFSWSSFVGRQKSLRTGGGCGWNKGKPCHF